MRGAQEGRLPFTSRKELTKAENEQKQNHHFKVNFLKAKAEGSSQTTGLLRDLSTLSISVSWCPAKSHDHRAGSVLCNCSVWFQFAMVSWSWCKGLSELSLHFHSGKAGVPLGHLS